MLRPILQHVTALTERTQIRQTIIGGITVETYRREHGTSHPKPCGLHEIGPSCHPSAAAPPRRRLLIEPATIWQTAHKGHVWATTTLTPSSSTCEPNVVAQVAPVGRIQRSQLAADGHGYTTSSSQVPMPTGRVVMRSDWVELVDTPFQTTTLRRGIGAQSVGSGSL